MEKTPFRITGGCSLPRRISISSDRFTASATCRRDGTIVCRTKKRWRLMADPYRRLMVYALCITHVIMTSSSSRPWRNIAGELCIYTLSLCAFLLETLISIARWHAAEHMAIAAHDRTGSCHLEEIRREDRVNPKCGGRFVLPLLIVLLLNGFADVYSLRLGQAILFGGLWFIFFVDKRRGFDTMPFFARASELLQRYVTTRPPTEIELKTAQAALKALAEAHEAAAAKEAAAEVV